MAGDYIQFHFTCLQCGNDATRPYRGSGVRPSLCGNACKVAAYRARNPEAVKEGRIRERLNRPGPPARQCQCGVTIGKRRRLCDQCLDDADKKRRDAIAARAKVCRDCDVTVPKAAQRCEPCRQRANDLSKQAFRLTEAFRIGRRTVRARRRAVERGIEAERFDPIEILSRDGWRCHICGCSTPKRLRGTYDHRAPEVDHIQPLSKGGQHTRINTACACRKCNLMKGGEPLGQLRLVA